MTLSPSLAASGVSVTTSTVTTTESKDDGRYLVGHPGDKGDPSRRTDIARVVMPGRAAKTQKPQRPGKTAPGKTATRGAGGGSTSMVAGSAKQNKYIELEL